MPGEKRKTAKQGLKFFCRAVAGGAQGIVVEPVALNKKMYSTVKEKTYFDEFVTPHDYMAIFLLVPATAVIGVFYGLARGVQLGIRYSDEGIGDSVRHINDELFTCDSEFASYHLNDMSEKEIRRSAEQAGVSVRKIYSDHVPNEEMGYSK